MKRVLSTMTQSSSKTPLALKRQQNIILLIIACFALVLTAPTTPVTPSIPNEEALNNTSEKTSTDPVTLSRITSQLDPINDETLSLKKLNDSPTVPMTIPSTSLDTVTIEVSTNANGMMTKEKLIGTTARSEADLTLNIQAQLDNGITKTPELNESTEVSPSTLSKLSTERSILLDSLLLNVRPSNTAIQGIKNNENKSINFDHDAIHGEQSSNATTPDSISTDGFTGAQSVATTIEMPIKPDADNMKIMEKVRDFPLSTSGVMKENEGVKKAKFKESKKKALKAHGGNDKKQKLKQKLFSDINHSSDPINEEPPPLAQLTTETAREAQIQTTTHEPTVSTSIKTAPTTIKSTTLTTIKSFRLKSDTTQSLSSNQIFSTEPSLNFIESRPEIESTQTTWSPLEPSVTANEQPSEQHNRSGDKVIVLNTNSSGLIVVDFLENFGSENATNTETFEIKMDLIDETTTMDDNRKAQESEQAQVVSDAILKSPESTIKDDIFLTTIESTTTVDSSNAWKTHSTTINDDIILINENNESTTTQSTTLIKWKEVKSDEGNGNIKITFDNIDLQNQNVNVSIENGELVIDSIDISVLNKAEEELKKKQKMNVSSDNGKLNKTDSLEIILIEDDSHQEAKHNNRDNLSENDESNLATPTTTSHDKPVNNDDSSSNSDEKETKINESNGEEFLTTTIHFDLPTMKHDRLDKFEMGRSDEEDGIKIKTTDKDSDTIFYISNTEVKVIESIPTSSPNVSHERNYYPAIYEEDVIVDLPRKNRTSGATSSLSASDKYEEDIVLSPLTSDFDPKDINYIGEAFLDVEESQNSGGLSENHHIIPLTSDVVIQPVQLRDMSSIGIPIIGELPPQIELDEMVFSDDYDNKQQTNFRVEEYYPNFLSNRLVKNQLDVDVPKEIIFDSKNNTVLFPNRTHISINTMINGTNSTALSSSLTNVTSNLGESEENENSDLNDIQTLFLACFATLVPLSLCVIIILTIRYCWRKYRREGSSGNDMMSDKSTDPLAEKNAAPSSDELKSAESGMTLDRGEDIQASTELLLSANGDCTSNNHHSNGSIITMTLKNNHLIVETEERNDISRDTRETKMHYSPSEKDGVFIVESARGADQNGSHKKLPIQQKSPEAPLVIPDKIKIDTLQSHFTPSSPEEEYKQPKPEQVEVHTPPAELKENFSQKGPEPVICNGTKTGLSQSDLSLTSTNSSNQNYTYGDKDAYQFEEKGYKGSSPKRIINVHCHDLKPLIENSPPAPIEDLNKPVITSAIFKNDSPENEEPLKSDAQATDENTIPTTNGNDLDKAKVHKVNGFISTMRNGLDEIISFPDENCNDASFTKIDCNGELNMESLSFLPAPPEELNDQCILEFTSMDSLPPPPPVEEVAQS